MSQLEIDDIKVVEEFPPNWEQIKSIFPVENANILMAFDGKLWNPYKLPLRDDLVYHEAVHLKQQEKAKEKGIDWWERYISNPQWRIEVEAVAYGKQVAFIKKTQGEVRSLQALKSFAKYLSSKVYGETINEHEAFEKIRKASKA